MNHVIAVLVRLSVLGLALAGYYAALPYLFPDGGGGAAIGAGLIAFGALMLIGLGGCFVDTWRHGAVTAIAWWLVIAAGLAVGWWIALAVPQDTSMSFGELFVADAGTLPFTFGLVAGPAVIGAVIGNALPRRSEP